MKKIKKYITLAILYLIKGLNHIIPFASIFNEKVQKKIKNIKIELKTFYNRFK